MDNNIGTKYRDPYTLINYAAYTPAYAEGMHPENVDRFLSKIHPIDGGCWMWTGSRTAGGYGRFAFDGSEERAHRYSYRYFIGALPDYTYVGDELDHLCRNRGCVNPTHLELVPHVTNIRRGLSGHCSTPEGKAVTAAKVSAWRQNTNPASPMLGRTHSPEAIKKMSEARLASWAIRKAEGRATFPNRAPMPESMKQKLRGRHVSAETRALISAAASGRVVSAETRTKLSAASKGRGAGRTLSEDTRAKLSAIRREWWRRKKESAG